MKANERDSLLPSPSLQQTDQLTGLFERPTSTARIPPNDENNENATEDKEEYWIPVAAADHDTDKTTTATRSTKQLLQATASTITGSVVFLIYHTVFCLAQAATITRPDSQASVGLLAKTAALGVITAGPVFTFELGDLVPAIYPASDLFLAPFLAQLANQIDAVLGELNIADNTVFLATWLVTVCMGFVLSGSLCVAAARYHKLANVGAFLPYSVLCGFFATIGILMWTLGFSVDTGLKVGELWHAQPHVVFTALLHHAPSVVMGVLMHLAGKAHPTFVIALEAVTVLGSYSVMWLTGTSLAQAQELKWFFSPADLVVDNTTDRYGPPSPFGVWVSLWRGQVVWQAVAAGIPTVLALAFLYVIRCSLHAAALKKNIPNVTRKNEDNHQKKNPKKTLTLGYMLEKGYGYAQLVSAMVGGITVAPSVAASLTMFHLGAEATAPQYGSCLLLFIFYWTDFSLVQYIPKPAFSSLMVLAGIDMCYSWLYGSFFKTQDKLEWLVAPVLVILAFWLGVLQAIFLGVAVSTFIFAANVYRAGTVKYVGHGLTLRSTVERGPKEAAWLDQNADWIQILVLQNYLFFGNAQSVLNYVTTMFDDDDEVGSHNDSNLGLDSVRIPPVPKYLIVDFSLVSGMDTSAVDLFRDIVNLCSEHQCQLFLAGTSPNVQSMLCYAGITRAGPTSYIGDLETALGRAEDGLLSSILHVEERDKEESANRQRDRSESLVEDGFLYALRKIDEQHGLDVARELEDLRSYTIPVDLAPGEVLVREPRHAGVYFVETGLMRVRPTSSLASLSQSTGAALSNTAQYYDPALSIGHLDARSRLYEWKEEHLEQTFRLARIGQGWVIGCIEAANGLHDPGVHVAMSPCRLHHLPYHAIQDIETSNPELSMHLYKLLALLATKRQESTIHQLDQFVKIMNAPTPRLRGGKRELAKLQISS